MGTSLVQKAVQCAIRFAIGGVMALTLTSCGGGGGSAGTVPGQPTPTPNPTDPVVNVGSISLIFSNTQLPSSGVAGTEVGITALVKSPTNNSLENVTVAFSANSGALTVLNEKTNASGQAKATLGTSGDRTNRTITVTAAAGGQNVAGTVNVVGTSVTMNGPSSVILNGTADFTVAVKDSAGNPVPNVPFTFSSNNTVAIQSQGAAGTIAAPLTDSQGQAVLRMTGSVAGTGTLSFSSQGVNATSTINVSATQFSVQAVDGGGNPVTTANTSTACQRIAAQYSINGVQQNDTLNVTTSRGTVYSDAACTIALAGAVPITNGIAQATYVRSNTAGVATITGTVVSNGISAQTNLNFIAPLTALATISVQAAPSTVGTNTVSSQSQQSTLTAIVRDGTANNNPVQGAVVNFSILTDPSGGTLSPSQATTAANGTASVAYIAGTTSTALNGVQIRAAIQGHTGTADTNLTVSGQSLFISTGTGNQIAIVNTTQYSQDWSVFVTDATGNAVPGVTITASIVPDAASAYGKGKYVWNGTIWDIPLGSPPTYRCANEDTNQNGILDAGEDFNGSGILEPGIPVTVTSSGTTDSTGAAIIKLTYPKDRAGWVRVKMSVTGSVGGTEARSISTFTLAGAAADYSNVNIAPPGQTSPYGVNACNLPD